MSFWNSPLIKSIEEGQLPTIKTEVVLPRQTLVNLGITVMVVAVGITALIVILRITK